MDDVIEELKKEVKENPEDVISVEDEDLLKYFDHIPEYKEKKGNVCDMF